MKKFLIVALMTVAGIAHAGHPRCAGSYEPQKCEAFEAKLAAETPEQKQASAKKLEAERTASMEQAKAHKDTSNPTVKQTCYSMSPYVGMSESTLQNLCHKPYWSSTTDLGSVVYRWYTAGNYRIMVKNGTVAAVSY